jgi:hypothetical protein
MNTSETGQRVCHAKVMEVAKAAAGELYESMMSNDAFFKAWKKQNPGMGPKQLEARFIEKNWGSCLEFARATLTVMLTRPDVAEEMKEEIMLVLEQDQILRHKRVASPPFRPIH